MPDVQMGIGTVHMVVVGGGRREGTGCGSSSPQRASPPGAVLLGALTF